MKVSEMASMMHLPQHRMRKEIKAENKEVMEKLEKLRAEQFEQEERNVRYAELLIENETCRKAFSHVTDWAENRKLRLHQALQEAQKFDKFTIEHMRYINVEIDALLYETMPESIVNVAANLAIIPSSLPPPKTMKRGKFFTKPERIQEILQCELANLQSCADEYHRDRAFVNARMNQIEEDTLQLQNQMARKMRQIYQSAEENLLTYKQDVVNELNQKCKALTAEMNVLQVIKKLKQNEINRSEMEFERLLDINNTYSKLLSEVLDQIELRREAARSQLKYAKDNPDAFTEKFKTWNIEKPKPIVVAEYEPDISEKEMEERSLQDKECSLEFESSPTLASAWKKFTELKIEHGALECKIKNIKARIPALHSEIEKAKRMKMKLRYELDHLPEDYIQMEQELQDFGNSLLDHERQRTPESCGPDTPKDLNDEFPKGTVRQIVHQIEKVGLENKEPVCPPIEASSLATC